MNFNFFAVRAAMSRNAALLRLVESAPFSEQSGAFWDESPNGRHHSLHTILPDPAAISAGAVEYLLERFSSKSSRILDPWCGSGTTLVQGTLMGRHVIGVESDDLFLTVARGKIAPADITEVALLLQGAPLRGPLDLMEYEQYFAPFFHVNTYAELLHLRAALRRSQGGTQPRMAFVQILAAGVLHGPSAGYVSVAMSPYVAPSAAEQRLINRQQGLVPEYRALSPRLIRKSAFVTRDGVAWRSIRERGTASLIAGSALDLHAVTTGSVDLVISRLPARESVGCEDGQWLRRWLLGVQAKPASEPSASSWLESMNASLLEAARVTKRGGRLALVAGSDAEHDMSAVRDMVSSDLFRFWELELLLRNQPRAPVIAGGGSYRRSGAVAQDVALVCRRR